MSNVEKEYTINGKVYRLVEEEKKHKRLEFYIESKDSIVSLGGDFLKIKAWNTPVKDGSNPDEMRFVHLREGETIVSRDDVRALLERYYFSNNNIGAVLKEMGF